jgi:predicted membrane channel-forming protein YqfA (hemolysin III family)
MDIIQQFFGLTIQQFIYVIFLPFLFFYLFLYGLLRKAKIFGDDKSAKRLDTMLSLVISALGILSLYSLGFTVWLPYLAAVLAVASFVVLYVYGVLGHSIKKTSTYTSGYAFKTDEEKKYDSLVADCKNIWTKFKKEHSEQSLKEMASKVAELSKLAQSLGKSLYTYDWFNEFNSVMQELNERIKAGE